MEGAALANGEAAPGTANEGTDTAEVAANQQRDEEQGAANGGAELEGSANQGTGSPANPETELQELTNDNEGPQPANEDRAQKAPTNQDTGHKAPAAAAVATPATNQHTAPPAPANQDSAPRAAANEDSTLQAPPNQAPPPQDPTNELAALPAAANGARDPWDWSQEEAWLRAPEEEELEAWGAEPEGWWAELEGDEEEEEDEDEDEEEAEEGPERWRPSPDGAWAKLIVRPGRGLARPGPGSLCRVLLSVPSSGPPAWGAVSPTSGAGGWASVRLGAAEGRWACVLDAALETMASGERARLRPAAAAHAAVTVRLGRFTPAPPFWEAPAAARWRSVTSGHARAAALLAQGLVGAAGRAYARALRAAVAAGGLAPLSAEVSGVKAELHAGLALVQLRLGLPAAAAANAGKALALRPAHLEARYRRAVAEAAMMDLEAAMADLAAVLRAQPGHAGARRELRRVRGAARERDARLARRLGRLFA